MIMIHLRCLTRAITYPFHLLFVDSVELVRAFVRTVHDGVQSITSTLCVARAVVVFVSDHHFNDVNSECPCANERAAGTFRFSM